MKNALIGIVAVAGLAASASAQFTGTGSLAFQVSTDNGATWSSSANVNPGAPVLVRLQANFDGNGFGVGKVGLGFVRFNNANASDTISTGTIVDNIANSNTARPRQIVDVSGGRQLQITRGTSGAATNPLAASNRLAWGQLTNDLSTGNLNPNYRAGSPVEVFRIAVTAGSFGRTITIGGETATERRGYLGFDLTNPTTDEVDYSVTVGTPQAGNPPLTAFNLREGQMTGGLDPATASITIIPTPASLALLGLGGLVAGRRRR
jgi:uncharacterized protein (TIGR03382 family)